MPHHDGAPSLYPRPHSENRPLTKVFLSHRVGPREGRSNCAWMSLRDLMEEEKMKTEPPGRGGGEHHKPPRGGRNQQGQDEGGR